MRVMSWASIGLLSFSMLGCGGDEPQTQVAKAPTQTVSPSEPKPDLLPPPEEPVPAEPESAETPEPEPQPQAATETLTPNAPQVPPPAIPEDPADLVKEVAKELAENRPQILWYALPESYQNEAFLLFAEPANKADPKLWAAVFDLIGELVATLREKKETIFDYPGLFDLDVDLLVLDQYYDPTVELLAVIHESKLKDIEEAKKINFGDLLATSGPRLVEQSRNLAEATFGLDIGSELQGVTAEVTSQEGDVAKVKIQAPGGYAEEIDFVRIEGKWLPKAVVESWPVYMETIRGYVSKLPVAAKDKKKQDQTLGIINTAKGFITASRKAKTNETFYANLDFILKVAGFDIPERKGADPNVSPLPEEVSPAENETSDPN